MQALTKHEDRRRRQLALVPRLHGPAPDRYRAAAEWWRIEAEESANPSAALSYADGQERLADDMERRPGHYRVKPGDKTDWQWSGLTSVTRLDDQ